MHGFVSWLGYWTGVSNEAGKGYAFWSGIGSCLAYLGVLAAGWRHLNCHARGCLRIGRHPVEGTPHKTCRRHHPTLPSRAPTTAEIHADHAAQRPERNHR